MFRNRYFKSDGKGLWLGITSSILFVLSSVFSVEAADQVLDDFDGDSLISAWWGADSVAPYVYDLEFNHTQHVHSGSFSLKVNYDKANDGNTYSFVSAMGYFNMRLFDYLSFWVYNDGSLLKIRIRLEDEDGNPWESNWADIEPETMTAAADWENLVVDLTRTFYGHAHDQINMEAITQIMLIVAPGEASGSGAFWIDDFILQRSPNTAPLEPFESDFYGWSAGGPFSLNRVTNEFHNDGTPDGLGQYSMKVAWGSKPSGYDNFIYTPAHDTESAPVGRIGNYSNFDLDGNTTIEAWVKSTTDNNLPILLKLDNADVATRTYTGGGDWQKLSWNYSSLTGAVDVETVWVFPYPGAADAGGVMYLDDFNLTGGTPPAIPPVPGGLLSTAQSPDEDGVFTVYWDTVSGIDGYELQEDTDPNFSAPASYFTTSATSIPLMKPVISEPVTYYYRIRSRMDSASSTNYGSFSKALSVVVMYVPVPHYLGDTLDDFDGNGIIGSWWGSDSIEPYCYELDFSSTQHVHSGTYSLGITFDKTHDTNSPYSFLAAGGHYNLSNFDYLSFWAYNDGSPLRIKVRFEETWDKAWETDWASIFPQTRTADADWENLVVDLTRTFNSTNLDWTAVKQIMFIVEGGSVTTNGQFWMDDIRLWRGVNSGPIETFESDFYGWASGGPFTTALSSNEVYNDGTFRSGLGQQSLEVTWGAKANGDYSNFTYEPDHDSSSSPLNRIGHYPNLAFRGNNMLQLWVKCTTDNDFPILLKFDTITEDIGTKTYNAGGDWQKMTWDFSGFTDVTNVSQVFFMPYPGTSDDGGQMYIDDMHLLGGIAPALPLAPTGLRTSADVPDDDGSLSVSWNVVTGAANYELQVDLSTEFTNPVSYFPVGATISIQQDALTNPVTYYYRVRSNIRENEIDNYGSFTRFCSAIVQWLPQPEETSEVIESFDGPGLVSAWWGSDSVEPYAYQLDFANTQHVHSGTYALKIEYDKTNDAENLYTFLSASGQYNLRNFDYLSFWVYNDGTPVWIKIRFEETWDKAWESDWAGIYPMTQTPEADWENIVVDLSRTFSTTNVDWTAVKQIMIMIEPGEASATGTVWLDDIRLSRAAHSAPIEPFESDYYGWACGSPFALTSTVAEFHNDGWSARGLGQQSLMLTWSNKPDLDYSNVTYTPAHDTNSAPWGRIGNYPNLMMDDNYILQMWVMSPTDNNIPILLKSDSVVEDIGVRTYTGAGSWQKLSWDYSAFPGMTNVEQLFFMPYAGQGDDGGILYMDDISLIGGYAEPIPTPPEEVGNTAEDPDMDGNYTVTWDAVTNVLMYEIQEATDANFTSFVTYYTTNIWLDFAKDLATEGGTYYYRVRTGIADGAATNFGSFGRTPSIVRISSVTDVIKNQSYDTTCAEVDNINIPIAYPGVTSYRITALHPDYYPTSIGERGPDFDDCSFTHGGIWQLGTDDGSCDEFLQTGFAGTHIFYAPDDPAAGTDETTADFPKEINYNWMTNQYIYFTADQEGDVNLEVLIGSDFTIDFAIVNGTLELRASTWDGTNWIDQGTQVFNAGDLTKVWHFPDFTWRHGTDANIIHLEVVQAADGGQTTEGAWGVYDYILMDKRQQGGEFFQNALYDDGNIIIVPVFVDFWWRAPEGMTINVDNDGTITTATNVHYFQIIKRLPDTEEVGYSQVFVLYEDGNARIEPHPPKGIDWVPFGSSVILGPTEDGDRPFVGIDSVTINPRDLSLDIIYDEGGSAHVEMWVDREKNVVDVTEINYDTLTKPFARFRSMWVYDGKSDIDRVATADGIFPIMKEWNELGGTWWRFFKEVPTHHNTYCPDFLVEARGVGAAFLIRQAEDFTTATNCVVSGRGHAVGLQAITVSQDGGEATYDINLTEDRPDSRMIIRYADEDGGNNGDYPGNLIDVYLDDIYVGHTYSWNTGGWDSFEDSPSIELGDMGAGPHEIKLVIGGMTFGVDLDQFELISHAMPVTYRQDILSHEAENTVALDAMQLRSRSNASGGDTIAITGTVARFNAPRGTAVDNDGFVYIADTGNHTIRKSSPVGVVSTLAGLAGHAGAIDDTGSAARFNSPGGIAVSRSWDTGYIVADTGNHTIRKVTADGIVTTLAGLAGASGSTDASGSAARFNSPMAVALDSAWNVYVADSGNHTIRKITSSGDVTTLAGLAGSPGNTDGTGSAARFNNPTGIAIDEKGCIYIADTGNHTIRLIDTNGMISTYAGLAGSAGSADGIGSAARFNSPEGVAVAWNWPWDVQVSDTGNHTIRYIVNTNGYVSTLIGQAGQADTVNATGTTARLESPRGIGMSVNGGEVYVSQGGNHLVRRIVSPNMPSFVGFDAGVTTILAGDKDVAGSDDVHTDFLAEYTINLPADRDNVYANIHFSDLVGGNKVELYLDGVLAGRIPTDTTDDWNLFGASAAMYLGDLTAGNHSLNLKPYAGSSGVELDRFDLFTYTGVVSDAAGYLQFAASTYNVNEADGTAQIAVSRFAGDTGSVTVNYSLSDGTAVAGQDYTDAIATLTFPDGVSTQYFNIPITLDSSVEGIETINLHLSAAGGGAMLGQRSNALLNIEDANPGTLQLASGSYIVHESQSAVTIVVERVEGNTGSVSADYYTLDESAMAGEDYSYQAGTLTFADGQVEQSVVIPILDDVASELDEVFSFVLCNVIGATPGTPDTAEVTIWDDEVYVPLALGTTDGSSAEFAQDNYQSVFDSASMRVGDFPQELNLTSWSTQHIVIVVDQNTVVYGLWLSLVAASSDGQGALDVRVDVDSGSGYQVAGTMVINAQTSGVLSISSALIAEGTNLLRLVAQSGTAGTTGLFWDSIIINPQLYVNHLAYADGVDSFPGAQAEQTNYTGVACSWMIARYLLGETFTDTQTDIYNANIKDPLHNNEITPQSCTSWLIDKGWQPYWFSLQTHTNIEDALQAVVYWIDYEPVDEINVPACIVCGTNWSYKVVRGFQTDRAPYDGLNNPRGASFILDGVWLNDPLINGLGYDMYVVADEMTSIFTPSDASGGFQIIVEPPADGTPASMLDGGDMMLSEPAPNPEVAAYLNSLVEDDNPQRGFNAELPVGGVLGLLPFALRDDIGFMQIFDYAVVNDAYIVNDGQADEYMLVGGGVNGPASTMYILKVDAAAGVLRQATWSATSVMFPAVPEDAAVWYARQQLGNMEAPLLDAQLIYDPNIDPSPFFPHWEVQLDNSGHPVTEIVPMDIDTSGDDDADGMSNLGELYAGFDPADINSALFLVGEQNSTQDHYPVIEWESQSERNYTLYRTDNLNSPFTVVARHINAQPPMNSYTDRVSGVTAYYKIEVE